VLFHRNIGILFILLALTATFAFAQIPAVVPSTIDYDTVRFDRVAKAVRLQAEEKIQVDGNLTDPGWNKVEPATNFIQYEPNTGVPATEQTEVRFLYDADNLYVGVRCFDSEPDRIVSNEMKRDIQGTNEDGFAIYLDTLHDERTGFFLGINPAGGRRDGQVTDSNDSNLVNYDWNGVWDVKVSRDDQGWAAEFVIPFKTLRFTNSPSQIWGLNMLRRVRRKNEDSTWTPLPRRYRTPTGSRAGTLVGIADIHQGRNLKIKPYVSSGMTQVGANDGENRTFKNDGGVDLKYGLTQSLTLDLTYRTDFSQVEVDQQQVNLTRFSILFPEKREFFLENSGIFRFATSSKDTNLIPFFSRRIGLSPAGDPIPIVGGGRVSGKIGLYDVGVLAINTQAAGAVPSNNFLIGRVKRNVMRRSYIGALATTRNSDLAGDDNKVYGVDTNLLFDKIEIASYLLRSDTPGKSASNQARLLSGGWIDDDLSLTGQYEEVQQNFNPEVGFVRRKNMEHYSTDISWRPRLSRSKLVRNFTFAPGADYYARSNTGSVETRSQNFTTGITFRNSSSLNFNAVWTFDRLGSAFNIRPDVTIPAGDYNYTRYTVTANSDQGRTVSGNLNTAWGEFWNGRQTGFGSGVSFKPNYHLNIDLTYSDNRVSLPAGSFTARLIGARWLYAFSPKMMLNAFLQYNADTHQFISNVRYNIIHHPLSDLFVVYNERHDTVTGKLIDRAFLIKVTNLFNF
jgi:hypothetical protein